MSISAWSKPSRVNPSEPQNPYAPTSELRVYPDSISFDGIITEEMYRKLLPKTEKFLFLTLAFLLSAIAMPMMIVCLFFAIFVERKVEMFIGSVCVILFLIAAHVLCIRMASTGTRARSYLKQFPDLLGEMRGNLNSNGLILFDLEKTHWFPWVQLSHLVVSEAGVRVPLSDDPRRFLALAAEMFDSYRPSNMEQMRFRNRMVQTNYDQLAAQSAAVFQTEVGSASYYSGWYQQPVKWDVWITCLLCTICVCIFIAFQLDWGQWGWFEIGFVLFVSLGVIQSIRNLVQLLRNRNRATVMCWGWLSEKEIIFGSGVHVMQTPIASIKYIRRKAETLEFQFDNGPNYCLFRSHFCDTDHFDKISSMLCG